MSINCWMAIFIAVFLSTTAARPVSLDDPVAATGLKEHNLRTKAFKCSKPQNRSYSIKSVLPRGQISPGESIYPSYTVIRRCDDGTGCCRSSDQSCRPIATESENVVVKVTNIVANQSSERILTIEHHNECACQMTSTALPLLPPKEIPTKVFKDYQYLSHNNDLVRHVVDDNPSHFWNYKIPDDPGAFIHLLLC